MRFRIDLRIPPTVFDASDGTPFGETRTRYSATTRAFLDGLELPQRDVPDIVETVEASATTSLGAVAGSLANDAFGATGRVFNRGITIRLNFNGPLGALAPLPDVIDLSNLSFQRFEVTGVSRGSGPFASTRTSRFYSTIDDVTIQRSLAPVPLPAAIWVLGVPLLAAGFAARNCRRSSRY